MLETILAISVMTVFALLAGFCFGKNRGRVCGYQEGKTETVLDLRRQSLEQGCCVLCGENKLKAETDRIMLLSPTDTIGEEGDCRVEDGTEKANGTQQI
jgi:hypothetical protein